MKIYSVLLTCAIVVLLFASADRLPESFKNFFMPGFFVVVMINGSLHDRIIPGYLILGVFFNCIFYSALALFGIWLFEKLRKSRGGTD